MLNCKENESLHRFYDLRVYLITLLLHSTNDQISGQVSKKAGKMTTDVKKCIG